MKPSIFKKQKLVFYILTFILLFCLATDAISQPPKQRDYWPTQKWHTATPESQEMNSGKLNIADEFIQNRLPDAFSLLVVKNGYLVFEKYYSWGKPNKYAVVHSVTKSVTSALIGIALEKGHLDNLDQKLIDFFPEYFSETSDPRKKEITLKHLLTMSAGFRWDDRGSSMVNWYSSLDWVKNAIQLPQDNEPGDVFNYNSSTSHLLAAILSKSTQMSTLEFAKANLFQPLGIETAFWHTDPDGYNIGGFGLGLAPRDLAKIGFLFLNNGYWDGKSIVPENWVRESTRGHLQAMGHPIYGPFAYGYQWWVKKVDGCDSFRAWGRRGQYIVIVPVLDLVIAVTSETASHPPTSIHYCPLFDLVAEAVDRPRQPKAHIKAVEVPLEIQTFLDEYNRARKTKNMAVISDFISDRFLYRGVNKNMALQFLQGMSDYTAEAVLIITRFKLNGDEAILDVWLQDRYFYEAAFMTETKLVKEGGQWRWYGNQQH